MRAQNEVMVQEHNYICPGSDKQLMIQRNRVCIGTKDETQYGAQQGCTGFPKILESPQNSIHQKGDMNRDPY
jgi:hypothetical protein